MSTLDMDGKQGRRLYGDCQDSDRLAELIRVHFIELVSNTVCGDKVVDMLWSNHILTEDERQEIKSSRTEREKSTRFYHILRLKDEWAISTAVELLRVHNGSNIPYELLKEAAVEVSVTSRRQAEQKNVAMNHIRHICANVLGAKPKAPVTTFFGRMQELQEIHELLTSTDKNKLHILCISGLGGVGKSELARAYAKEYRDFYDGNCLWIHADSGTSIHESLLDIASDLDISTQGAQGRPRPLPLLVAALYRLLSPVRSLIIFDNVEKFGGPDGIAAALPNLPPELEAPWILLTSRITDWALVDAFTVLELHLLVPSLPESTDFLQRQLGLTSEEEIRLAEKLAVELDCLPLALQQASAYIATDLRRQGRLANRAYLLSKYLTRSKQYEQVFRDERYQRMSDRYEKTIMTTWSMTMRKISGEEQDEHAILWLGTLAYRRPFNIPEATFVRDALEYASFEECVRPLCNVWPGLAFGEQDEESIHQSLNLLANYSMICIDQGLISFHRLVGQVLMFQLRKQRQEEAILRLILTPLTTLDTNEFDLRRVESCKFWQHCLPYNNLVQRFSSSIGVKVNQNAIFNYPLTDTVTRFESVLGHTHEDTLAVKLICVTQYSNSAFIAQLPQLLQTCEQHLGKEHEVTKGYGTAIVNDAVKREEFKNALMFVHEKSSERHGALFGYASNMVLRAISKMAGEGKQVGGETLEELCALYDAWGRESGEDDHGDTYWICVRASIVLRFMSERKEEAIQLLNEKLAAYSQAQTQAQAHALSDQERVKFVAATYVEMMSFLQTPDMDTLFTNLIQSWDISYLRPGDSPASAERKIANWWLELSAQGSDRLDEFNSLNKEFGRRVAIKEPFNKWTPHGFISPMQDFVTIGCGHPRYIKVQQFLFQVSFREFEAVRRARTTMRLQITDNDDYLECIVALLDLDSPNIAAHLEMVGKVLAVYDRDQISKWRGGTFLNFLAQRARRLLSESDPASQSVFLEAAVKVLQMLHSIIAEGRLWVKANVPQGLVSELMSLLSLSLDLPSDRLDGSVFGIFVTLTDDNEVLVLSEENMESLLASFRGSHSDRQARKWVPWIFSNLAESGIIGCYASVSDILEECLRAIESHPQACMPVVLEMYLLHSCVVHTLFNAASSLVSDLEQRLTIRLESNLSQWMEDERLSESLSAFFNDSQIGWSSLEPLFRLLSDAGKAPIFHQFATWTLAGLLQSKCEIYSPMLLAWPEWHDNMTKLSNLTKCNPAITIILELMLSTYRVDIQLETSSQDP